MLGTRPKNSLNSLPQDCGLDGGCHSWQHSWMEANTSPPTKRTTRSQSHIARSELTQFYDRALPSLGYAGRDLKCSRTVPATQSYSLISERAALSFLSVVDRRGFSTHLNSLVALLFITRKTRSRVILINMLMSKNKRLSACQYPL